MKYKEAGRKEASSSLYHRLPETLETQRVKEVTALQSQVRACHMTYELFDPPPHVAGRGTWFYFGLDLI